MALYAPVRPPKDPSNAAAPSRLPRQFSRPRLLVELLILAACYGAYELTRIAVRSDHALAVRNAHQLYSLEQSLDLDPERWLNHLLNRHDIWAQVAGYYYATLHFVVTVAVLGWLYWRRPGHYRPQRTALILSSLTALLLFWRFPVTPPRFAVPGITDTLGVWHILEIAAPRSGSSVANLDAAMPSLHVGWAVWCAVVLWQGLRREHPRLAALVWLYPAATSVVVLGTGNHYVLDIVVGVALVAAGCAATQTITPLQDNPFVAAAEEPLSPRSIAARR
jgi:hypothetical protein